MYISSYPTIFAWYANYIWNLLHIPLFPAKIAYKSYKSKCFEWLNHPFPTFFLFFGDPKNGHPHRKIASLGPDPLPPVDSVFYFRVLGKAEKYSATGLAVSASAGGQCVS